jgi:hypothetical protein
MTWTLLFLSKEVGLVEQLAPQKQARLTHPPQTCDFYGYSVALQRSALGLLYTKALMSMHWETSFTPY